MAKKVLALDIDYGGIRAVEVVRRGRQKVVTQLAHEPMAAGTVVDGKVMNDKALTAGLANLLLKQDFSAESTVLGVRSNWVTVKTHRFPTMPQKELDKALEFEIPDLVAFPVQTPKDVAYDYFINSRTDNEVEVVMVACPRQLLNPYIRIVREVGLKLEGIDVPAFGWPELIGDNLRRGFVEVTEEQTTIQVIIGGVFKVLRVIPIGALHLRQAVEEAFNVSSEEAQELFVNRDLDYLLVEGSGSKRVLRSVIQQFSGSILQTLDFVRAQERTSNFRSMLDEMVMMGDLADLVGLGEMLEKEIDLPVRSLKHIDSLQVSFDFIRPGRFSCFGSALALGVRGLEQ